MTTKLKPVKGWAVAYNGNIDSDKMNWGGQHGQAYPVFVNREEAYAWLGHKNISPNSSTFLVLIIPIFKRKTKK